VKPNAYQAAEKHSASTSTPVQMPKSQIQVVAVLDGATVVPPFRAADFYAAQEALSQSNREKERRGKKRMALAGGAVVLLLLVLTPWLVPGLLPRLAMVKQSVEHRVSAMDASLGAGRSKPSPSTPLTKGAQPASNGLLASSAAQPLSASQPATGAEAANSAEEADSTPVESKMMNDQLAAPTRIPHDIKNMQKPEAPPGQGFGAASLDGLGNSAGNVVGRAFSGANKAPNVSVVAPARVNISSGVAAGMLVKKTLPVYPVIAKAAHMSGTVVLQATIATSGAITNLHVVSGPVMLQQAALEAVKNWKYRPYQLDGKPVEVDTTVNVVFTSGIQ